MERDSLTFLSGGFHLIATVDLPDKVAFVAGSEAMATKLVPGVLFCHGFTGNRIEGRRLFARLGAQLADAGIACFRFDHRGCGESDGDFRDFTAEGILQDLDCAMKEFYACKWLDHPRTAVLGYSLGGISASYVLSKCPKMRTGVLWAPVSRPELLRRRLEDPDVMQQYQRDAFAHWSGYRVSSGLFEHLDLLKPLQWAKAFPNPMLFCHAAGDETVTHDHSDAYMNARQNPQDFKYLIEGGDHGFGDADQSDAMIARSAEWLIKKLNE